MEKVYSKIKPDILLHIINKNEEINPQRQDLSPETEYLQVACFSVNKEKGVKAHKHIKQIRTGDITQESWLVLKGSIEIILYDLDDKPIAKKTLGPGDCLITFRGGHTYKALEDDTTIYEYKTGPYMGKGSDSVVIN